MKDYFYLNPSKMAELTRRLQGAEIKMLYAMMYCTSSNNSTLFINNAENRKLMKKMGFDKTPERISSLLGSLVKKGAIKREVNGVYSLSNDLFRLADEDE